MRKKIAELIGIPFLDGGRDRNGLDCYGLCLEVAEIYGQKWPDFKICCYDSVKIHATVLNEAITGGWVKLSKPEEGCLVVFAIDAKSPNVCQHIGMYVGENQIIHTLENIGAHIIRTDHGYFKNKIKGYYKRDTAREILQERYYKKNTIKGVR